MMKLLNYVIDATLASNNRLRFQKNIETNHDKC